MQMRVDSETSEDDDMEQSVTDEREVGGADGGREVMTRKSTDGKSIQIELSFIYKPQLYNQNS